MTSTDEALSVWEALGLPIPSPEAIFDGGHIEARLPDGLIVDRDIAQVVSILRRAGVETAACCIDGWWSGVAYVIVATVDDLDRAARILGHDIDPGARAAVAHSVASDPVHRGWQCYGPWWPSLDGWVVGAVHEAGSRRPAIAWPTAQTPEVERHAVEVTGLAPVRLRRPTLCQWFARGGDVVIRDRLATIFGRDQ